MPVLAFVLKYSDTDTQGKLKVTLHNNVKAQNAVIRKIAVVKSAVSAATEYRINIQQPELFHECFSTAKHGTFPIPNTSTGLIKQLEFGSGLSLGIGNLSNILEFRVYNTDGSIVTSDSASNKANWAEITIYMDYQTNDLF